MQAYKGPSTSTKATINAAFKLIYVHHKNVKYTIYKRVGTLRCVPRVSVCARAAVSHIWWPSLGRGQVCVWFAVEMRKLASCRTLLVWLHSLRCLWIFCLQHNGNANAEVILSLLSCSFPFFTLVCTFLSRISLTFPKQSFQKLSKFELLLLFSLFFTHWVIKRCNLVLSYF